MAIPQGSEIFNTQYFASLIGRVNAAYSCAELQAIVTECMGSIQGVESAIGAQLAAINPILSLLTPPGANPTAIVTWLTTFITAYLTPYVKPTVTLAAQLVQLTAQIAALTAAITSAQSRFANCTISIPPII